MESALGKSVNWGVALLCGLLLVNGFLSFRNLQLVRENMLRADVARQAMMALDEVLALTIGLETAARGYAITGQSQFLTPYETASEDLTKSLESARESLIMTGNDSDAVELAARVNKRYELSRTLVNKRRDEGLQAAQAWVESGIGSRQMESVREFIADVHELEEQNLKYWSDRSDTRYRTALIYLLNATAGGIVLIGAIYYLTRREALQRQQNERLLKATEMRFRRLADANVIGVLLAGYNGRILEANDSFLNMLGFTRDDLASGELNWMQLTPTEFGPLDRQAIDELKSTGICKPYEKEFQRRDGARVPCLIGCAQLEAPGDTAICYAIDLTQRNQAADTIRKLNRDLEERVHELETLLELMPIGIAIAKDPNCRNITTNPACADMLGLAYGVNASLSSGESQRPRSFCVMRDGVELSADELPMHRCVATGQPVLGEEVEIVRNDGMTLKLLQYIAPLFDDQQAVRGGVGVFIDVTERVRLASKLQEHASFLENQQHWLQSLLNLLPIPLLLLEQPAGTTKFANRAAKEIGDGLLPLNGEPLDDRPTCECTDAAGLQIPPERMPMQRIARGDRLDHYEINWHLPDGQRTFLINSDSLPAMHGQQPVAVMVFQDITQIKLVETELRRTNQAKDALLAMLGHELRNPLAAITGAADVVATHTPEEPPYRTALEILKRHVGHLTQLVNDMLDLTRLTTGRIRLRAKLTDLREPLTHAVQAADTLIESRQHVLRIDLPDAPVHLIADSSRLEQVFSNLLVNAAKYTDPGGRIELRLSTAADWAVVSIRDTGIGIDPEKIPWLFDLFAQVDPALDRSRSGLGIGLTVVKNLVELHGGSVEVRSDGPGKGSEFIVRLPLSKETLRLPLVAAPPVADGLKPLQILLVEDNPDIAHLLVALIRRCGHQPTWADSGPAALNAVQTLVPDLGLLDIGLPGMNGYELADELRKHRSLSSLPLVALTGFGQEEDKHRSEAAGFARHLVKPISFDTLQCLFRELCG
jgi:PAS domain S-box-containing protein